MNFTTASSTKPSPTQFVLPFGPIDAIVSALTVYYLSAFGLAANAITIVTIQKSSNLNKSTWNQLITSLSISDLLSAAISPFYVQTLTWGFDKWNLPKFLCKLALGVDQFTSYVTTLHILWFSILRFVSLQWPHQFKAFASRYGKKSIAVIWMLSALAGFIPMLIFIDAHDRNRNLPSVYSRFGACGGSAEGAFALYWYLQVTYPVFFYIPFVLITCFSLGIGIKIFALRKTRNGRLEQSSGAREGELNRRKKENHVVVQLALIVGSFMLGYLPNTALYLYVFGKTSQSSGRSPYEMVWRLSVVAHILLRVSECLNPIFYNLASSEMRQETTAMLKDLGKKMKCCPAEENINPAAVASGTAETNV